MEKDLAKPIKIKSCARCAKDFECLHSAECWCAEYSIAPEAMNQLQKNFDNCLCPDCLSLFGEKKSDLIR
jgi:hypothetical protein